jgi:hypothetical protein
MPQNESKLGWRWEQAEVQYDRPTALELTFTVPDAAPDESPRLPLSVGLSIDRSGSMGGPKLAAARTAATGLLDGLKDGEQFAAAAFDQDVIDIAPSRVVNADARASIRPAIDALSSGGTTALFDGFARAAELVAKGGTPDEADSWVIVLSDGMGNQGLTEPAAMRRHAGAIADRGIRTIAVGIGDEYQADQLTALAEGGGGEFHHASQPDEIVEIVLGELRALRSIGARDLRIHVEPRHESRWLLIGGDARRHNGRVEARFDRVSTGREIHAVVLLWPSADRRFSVDASWVDREQHRRSVQMEVTQNGAPAQRDVELATRAAGLWHAYIIAKSLELNERGRYDDAETWLRNARREFKKYVEGLPGASELIHTLTRVEGKVGAVWETMGRRETFVMARKVMLSKPDLREHAQRAISRRWIGQEVAVWFWPIRGHSRHVAKAAFQNLRDLGNALLVATGDRRRALPGSGRTTRVSRAIASRARIWLLGETLWSLSGVPRCLKKGTCDVS